MNDFTKAECELVETIVSQIQIFAKNCVMLYAEPCDQEAAAQAVIQLVKERLNAH